MKALTWRGKGDIRCESVPDPSIQHPRDAIIKVTACAICGSDLHLFDGVMPSMESGDVLGHETMGEVVEIGFEVTNLKKDDRVVVPFTIACGECFFCKRGFFSGCERFRILSRCCAKGIRMRTLMRGRLAAGVRPERSHALRSVALIRIERLCPSGNLTAT
jgi:threonine dehydrogenase-like Zn-dependent dehydrogenase